MSDIFYFCTSLLLNVYPGNFANILIPDCEQP
jgi:hypothetical protein